MTHIFAIFFAVGLQANQIIPKEYKTNQNSAKFMKKMPKWPKILT